MPVDDKDLLVELLKHKKPPDIEPVGEWYLQAKYKSRINEVQDCFQQVKSMFLSMERKVRNKPEINQGLNDCMKKQLKNKVYIPLDEFLYDWDRLVPSFKM